MGVQSDCEGIRKTAEVAVRPEVADLGRAAEAQLDPVHDHGGRLIA